MLRPPLPPGRIRGQGVRNADAFRTIDLYGTKNKKHDAKPPHYNDGHHYHHDSVCAHRDHDSNKGHDALSRFKTRRQDPRKPPMRSFFLKNVAIRIIFWPYLSGLLELPRFLENFLRITGTTL